MRFLTVIRWLYGLLKGRWMSGFLGLLCLTQTDAQPKLKQLSTRPAVAMSADTYHRLIVADANGTITAYDTTGARVTEYSPRIVAEVSAIEAYRSLQILVFYRDLQQYMLLDRFLTPLYGYQSPSRLPENQIGFVSQMAFAYDNQFWLFDDADFSLKKYDARRQTVSSTIPMSLILNPQNYQITDMREYQNQLFVCDRHTGILVFDNLGNYRKTLPVKSVSTLRFYQNEIYTAEGATLHFYDLYTQARRQLPIPCQAIQAVVLSRHLFISNADGVFLYTLP